MVTRKKKVSKIPSFRSTLCTRVAKIAAYVECGQRELAKHHAIELQNMLIEHGLLVDGSHAGCHNGQQIGEA